MVVFSKNSASKKATLSKDQLKAKNAKIQEYFTLYGVTASQMK